MKKLMFLSAIMVILLITISELRLNEKTTTDIGGDKGETIKVNSMHRQNLHKDPLPYRDDADYSEHGNDLFPLEEKQPFISPDSHLVPLTGR